MDKKGKQPDAGIRVKINQKQKYRFHGELNIMESNIDYKNSSKNMEKEILNLTK